MERIPEPELMVEDHQAQAYALADFEEAHRRMLEVFDGIFPSLPDTGHAVDLGCGPGDIACRFAARYPGWRVDGVDASRVMLGYGPVIVERYPGVATRVALVEGLLPHCPVPRERYDVVLSNSLLHHLADPQALWSRCLVLGCTIHSSAASPRRAPGQITRRVPSRPASHQIPLFPMHGALQRRPRRQ